MKRLGKTVLTMAAAIFVATGIARADQMRVGVATEPYPPFATPDASGKYVGWEIDIADAICKAAKLDCVITPTAWDGIIPALTSNKIDFIAASLSITAERMKTIDFSNKYYQTGAAVVGAKGMSITPTAEGLKGKNLGVQTATIHLAYAKKYFVGANVKEYQTQDEANQDLVAGRIDATLADVLALEPFLKAADGSACCEMSGLVKNDPEILGKGVGFGLRKGSDDLKAKLNAAIDTIRADGTYDKISAKYFNFNIYGD